MTSIAERLERVRERIRDAARSAGRDPGSVRLIAVSKTQPASAVAEAYAAGQRDFGENYVQELTAKAAEHGALSELRWHMIGHLQRNKARHLAPWLAAIHSLDTPELAIELGRRIEAARPDARVQVLVEVNIASEPQKHGAAPAELGRVLEAVERESRLLLVGLMCVPPVADGPEGSRAHFEALAALRERHGGSARLPELSMGMTADLEPAIQAGSTMVRVGTAIFGERPPKGG